MTPEDEIQAEKEKLQAALYQAFKAAEVEGKPADIEVMKEIALEVLMRPEFAHLMPRQPLLELVPHYFDDPDKDPTKTTP